MEIDREVLDYEHGDSERNMDPLPTNATGNAEDPKTEHLVFER